MVDFCCSWLGNSIGMQDDRNLSTRDCSVIIALMCLTRNVNGRAAEWTDFLLQQPFGDT